jgi:hypothetical protein
MRDVSNMLDTVSEDTVLSVMEKSVGHADGEVAHS